MTRRWTRQDRRPPWQVQAALEVSLDAVFGPGPEPSPARRVALVSRAGLHFTWTLSLQATTARGHRLGLAVEVRADPALPADLAARQTESWIALWTRDPMWLPETSARAPRAARDPRTQATLDAWAAEDAALDDPQALRARIVKAVRGGACFRISHHEGETLLRFDGERFLYQESGETIGHHVYADEAAFLAGVRRVMGIRVGVAPDGPLPPWPDTPAERAAWRLILRQLPQG